MRYEYTFKQVEEQLQNFAHRILVDTVNMLGEEYKGPLYVDSHGSGEISKLKVEFFEVRFYAKHASVTFKLLNGKILQNEVFFDIAHMIYSDSPHNSKISFYAMDEDLEKRKSAILRFLAELMGNIKPDLEHRFSLKKYVDQRA
jgi:hypothetical protein